MGKHRDFEDKDQFFASWTDAIQEYLSASFNNLRLVKASASSIAVEPAVTGRQSVAFNGPWRYRDEKYTLNISGGAGTKTIWAVAVTANNFEGGGNDPDETDYNFELRATTGAEPGEVAYARKVGEVVWSGSAITSLIQTLGGVTGAMIQAGALNTGGDIEWTRQSDGSLLATVKTSTEVGKSLVPAGTMLMTGRETAPSGYLMCDGSEKSRETYAALFAAIGTKYGAGDGENTFNLPDGRGRYFMGADAGAGRISANDEVGQSGGDERMAKHEHTVNINSGNNSANHTHSVSGSTGYVSNDHTHWMFNFAAGGPYIPTSGGSLWFWHANAGIGNILTGGINNNHTHTVSGSTGNPSASHYHNVNGKTGTAGEGTGGNLPPYQVGNWIIKT